MKNNRNRLLSNGLFYIVVFLLLLWGINWALGGSNNGGGSENISYSQFVKDLRKAKLKTLVFNLLMVSTLLQVVTRMHKQQRINPNNSFEFL